MYRICCFWVVVHVVWWFETSVSEDCGSNHHATQHSNPENHNFYLHC